MENDTDSYYNDMQGPRRLWHHMETKEISIFEKYSPLIRAVVFLLLMCYPLSSFIMGMASILHSIVLSLSMFMWSGFLSWAFWKDCYERKDEA